MKRREFITLLGGAAAWPVVARAQQPERVRRIGVLMSRRDDRGRPGALQRSGKGCRNWAGRMAECADRYRFGTGDADRIRKYAAELVALAAGRHPGRRHPGHGAHCCRRPAPCRLCSSVYIDPVGAGLVESLARPGGNATGFTCSNTPSARNGSNYSKRSRLM